MYLPIRFARIRRSQTQKTLLTGQLPCIVFLLAIFASLAWGQKPSDGKKAPLPDFDLREAAGPGPAPRTQRAKALVATRTRNLETLVAQRQNAQPGIRAAAGKHGVPKLLFRDGGFLSAASTRDPDAIARTFLRDNAALFAFGQSEVNELRLAVRDARPEATFLTYNQTIGGIDVFEGQIKLTLSRAGEVVQVASGEIAPGLSTPTTPRLRREDAETAARSAARAQTAGRFLREPELVIFVLDASTARLAYRFFLEIDSNQLYEILIDAEDGTLLFRHNAYAHAAQGRVWMQSPSQGARQLVTFPDGWLPAGSTVTTGNNADAFVDADGDDTP